MQSQSTQTTPTVTIDGVTYACPFHDLFRPLTEDEFKLLRDSLRIRGQLEPVKVCIIRFVEDGFLNPHRCLIDGINRVREIHALGLVPRIIDLGELSMVDAREICIDLQAAGRNLSAGDLEQLRRQLAEERRERVRQARAERKSLREIAAAEGVSKSTVSNDLDMGEPGGVQGVDSGQQATSETPAVAFDPIAELEPLRKAISKAVTMAGKVYAGQAGEYLTRAARLHSRSDDPLGCPLRDWTALVNDALAAAAQEQPN